MENKKLYKRNKRKIKIFLKNKNNDIYNKIFSNKDSKKIIKLFTRKIINKNNYNLVFNQNNIELNILCIGSYIHCAKENTFIFGSGVRTPNNIEGGHKYNNLNICCVRGPLSRDFLIKK